METSDRSLARTGGLASFGVAAAYFASAVAAGLMPPDLQRPMEVTPHEFWLALSREPTAHLAFHFAWVAAGLFGIGAVPAISSLVWRVNRGAVLWSASAALLGFAVLARSHLMEAAFDRKVIPLYASADPAYQQAVHVAAGLALDVPDGVLTYGAIGVWILVVAALGLRGRVLPRWLCALGFAAGALSLAGMLGYTFKIPVLVVAAVGLGGALVAPAWFVSLAVLLRRRSS
jgi:hypothetical protein